MFKNGLKVKIEESFGDLNTGFVLYYETDGKIFVVKPIKPFEIEEYKGQLVETTFRLQMNEATDFIRSIVEIAEKRGIKTDKQEKEEARTTGTLESTRYHLEDMRKLVFKDKNG